MLEIKKDSLLKDTPEYEVYTENEVKLSDKEMLELGIKKGIGGCSKGENNSCGCSNKKKCCKK